jgi:tetratricopeptide (TPR) repeat protein
VFEDLHWADSGTLDFIDHVLEWSRNQPIFIVSLARPDLLERRPDWTTARRGFTSLFLEPLPEPAMRELLAGLVPDLPAATAGQIIQRSEGVPLYAIETIRMLVTDGRLVVQPDGTYAISGDLSELAVPETLTALIAARLDHLDPADRTLVLDAAVLGQTFSPAGLAAIAGTSVEELAPRLRSLVRRELLTSVADARSPERGQYAFVQALIREVAYNTLSKKDRKARHLAAARWFESLGDNELVGALAGHYLAARELASEGPEADALAAQARIALKAAGERAATLGALPQAVTFFEQAIDVTSDSAEEAELRRRAGEAATAASAFEVAETHLTRALELVRSAGDRSQTARLTASLGSTLLSGRRLEAALSILEPAAKEFADLGDDISRLAILAQISRAKFLLGDVLGSIAVAEQVLPILERTDQLAVLADTLVTKGSALNSAGRRREGLGVLEAGARIARSNGLTNTELRALNNALSERINNDPRAAQEDGLAGLALARRLGQGSWIHAFAGNMAFATLRTGDFEAGQAELGDALSESEDPLDRALLVNNLVNIQALRGESFEASMAELEETYAAHPPDAASFTLESRAYIATATGSPQEARDRWRELYAIDPVSSYIACLWTARISLWLGDVDAAAEDIARYWAAAPHEGIAVPSHDAVNAGVQALRGEREAAVAAYRDALARLREFKLPIDEVFTTIDMVYALGPSEPLVAETVAAARSIVARTGARPLGAILDRAIAAANARPATPRRTNPERARAAAVAGAPAAPASEEQAAS